MTPSQKIKHLILNTHAHFLHLPAPEITAENVDQLYAEAEANDDGTLQDARSEVRCSGESTDLLAPSSRHYDVEICAAQAPDGSWVAWPYYFGGGKHGEPEAVPWIEHAVHVACTQETRVVNVFSALPPAQS